MKAEKIVKLGFVGALSVMIGALPLMSEARKLSRVYVDKGDVKSAVNMHKMVRHDLHNAALDAAASAPAWDNAIYSGVKAAVGKVDKEQKEMIRDFKRGNLDGFMKNREEAGEAVENAIKHIEKQKKTVSMLSPMFPFLGAQVMDNISKVQDSLAMHGHEIYESYHHADEFYPTRN